MEQRTVEGSVFIRGRCNLVSEKKVVTAVGYRYVSEKGNKP